MMLRLPEDEKETQVNPIIQERIDSPFQLFGP